MPTFKISEDTRCEIKRFKEYAQKQEYTDATATGYCTYLSRFLRQAGLPEAGKLRKAVEAFLETEKRNHPQTLKYCRAALRLYFKMVTGGSLKKKPEVSPTPAIAGLLQRFREYSLEIKHLEVNTVDSETSHVRRFLEHTFAHDPQGFVNGLTAEDIRNYVVERLAALSDCTKGRHITSVRNFFRCQTFYEESVHPSIFRLPLSPAVWKKSAFPTTIHVDVFNTLHMAPDGDTDTGKRDRSIVLCFTELALRCSEVAALTLDDFNWHAQYVTVRNTKNGSDRMLPLSAKLRNALVEYLVLQL